MSPLNFSSKPARVYLIAPNNGTVPFLRFRRMTLPVAIGLLASAVAAPAPSVTTTVADTRLIHLAAIGAEGNLEAPPGMTERWQAASPNTSNSRDALASLSDVPQPTAGPTSPQTVTATRPGPRIAVHLALRPATAPSAAGS
jgi:hypothetical protein